MAEQSRYFAAEVRKTKQTLPAGAKVLEVGFGQGRFWPMPAASSGR